MGRKLYHGSSHKSASSICRSKGFDSTRMGAKGRTYGYAFYTTSSRQMACAYGKHVAEIEFDDDARFMRVGKIPCEEGKHGNDENSCRFYNDFKKWYKGKTGLLLYEEDYYEEPITDMINLYAKEQKYDGVNWGDDIFTFFHNRLIRGCEVSSCNEDLRFL